MLYRHQDCIWDGYRYLIKYFFHLQISYNILNILRLNEGHKETDQPFNTVQQ